MSTVVIRSATSSDVRLVLEMILELAAYERLTHEVVASEERLRETLFGGQPGAEVLLAYEGAECAGFALFFANYSTFLAKPGIYLEDLFVKPHFRGKGVGSALLKRLAALAVERDCGRINWQVLKWNEPSIQFYRKLGAEPLDDWTTYRLTGEALSKLARKAE